MTGLWKSVWKKKKKPKPTTGVQALVWNICMLPRCHHRLTDWGMSAQCWRWSVRLWCHAVNMFVSFCPSQEDQSALVVTQALSTASRATIKPPKQMLLLSLFFKNYSVRLILQWNTARFFISLKIPVLTHRWNLAFIYFLCLLLGSTFYF